jgi:hypothetical protein
MASASSVPFYLLCPAIRTREMSDTEYWSPGYLRAETSCGTPYSNAEIACLLD